jgi:multidrug efflux pump subunit AcrA (membrane-fusion protein)
MKDLGKEQIGEVDDGEVNAASQYEEAMATAGPKNRPGGVRPLLAVAGVLVVVIAAFFGWRYLASRSSGDEPGDQAPVVVRVSTAKAERGSISREVSAVGTITAARQSVVSANAPGQVRGLGILQNKFVKQGDLLARVNTTDLEAQKREAEAALREARLNIENLKRSAIPQSEIQARKDLRDAKASVDNAKNLYERRKDLYEKGGISLKDLEAARLALTQAENNLSYLENSNALRTGTSSARCPG